jgi:deoxyribose-phosphate aldolase
MFDSEDVLLAAHNASATCDVARRAVSLVDLTSLNDDDTSEIIAALCQRARTPAGPVAAVCVYPRFVTQAAAALEGSGIKVATVVNFPAGDAPIESIQLDTRQALEAGANEIDVVLPYRAYLEGRRQQAIAVLEAVCALSHGHARRRAQVKVILETGRLKDAAIILAASRDAISAGVDFLKTSTGKIETHATLEAGVAMLQAIDENSERGGRTVGLKVSGGLRDTLDAARYLALADAAMGEHWATPATFRFGASSLLDSLLATLDRQSGKPAATWSY